jgi:hypothetical protein
VVAIVVAHADVAQLVEHHLAKVRVAGSNPVVRSKELPDQRPLRGASVASRRRGRVLRNAAIVVSNGR